MSERPDAGQRREKLTRELSSAINRVSAENGSNTPDFILAELLADVLGAFDKSVNRRADWYGRHDRPGRHQEDVSGTPRPRNQLETALQCLASEVVKNPIALDKSGAPLLPHYLVAIDAIKECLKRRDP